MPFDLRNKISFDLKFFSKCTCQKTENIDKKRSKLTTYFLIFPVRNKKQSFAFVNKKEFMLILSITEPLIFRDR